MANTNINIILAIDPGESSGWVVRDTALPFDDYWVGGTIKHNRPALYNLLDEFRPGTIIFETFKLYATHAKSLINNKFYTCEIIGIIKLYADLHPDVQLIEQAASVKKYSGAKADDAEWLDVKELGRNVTEHTFDAYMHLAFYLRTHKNSLSPREKHSIS